MDTKELFEVALKQAESCVSRIEESELSNDTPCSEWDLKMLLNHMVYELSWAPDIIAGKTIKEVGDKYEGDLLGKDFKAAWRKACKNASSAVKKAKLNDVAHLSYGDIPMSNYIQELASDMLIHGWDVGQSVNYTLLFEDQIAKDIFERVQPLREEFDASEMFGPEITVEVEAPVQVKLLGFYGRRSPVA